MALEQLHRTQASILRALRYASAERFNTLMKTTTQTSDTFKFHLRKLIKLGFIEKRPDGKYQLTAVGKEFANSLEESQRTLRKQPTLSVFIVIQRPADHGSEFLMFKRARNPFIGYWTCITDPVRWGEPLELRAAKRLHVQTGLEAEFSVHSFHRVRNYAAETAQLLEDMMFAVMIGRNVQGEIINDYPGGYHDWLSLKDLRSSDKYYESTVKILEKLPAESSFLAQDLFHSLEEY